ncbi:hypothetical protein ASG82_00150 [Mycobacterium sp. Soil538]|nr:hypothetical protein ASG82_00150 [Mycobacterium sp. Soil538]
MATPELDERFTEIDVNVWTTSYLPAWSSRAEASATYDVGPDGLDLFIPSTQGLWCADLHDGPLRVSAIQSANRWARSVRRESDRVASSEDPALA